MACVGVGGCPWMVPSFEGASWASWWVPVKNDTNFQGPSTPVRWRPTPHGPPSWPESKAPPPLLSNPCPHPVQSLSNTVPSPVIARDLGPCVPAKTTGTQGYGAYSPVRQCGLGGHTTVTTWGMCGIHMLLLSVVRYPLLSFVKGLLPNCRPCAHN